eukprot:5141544-Amphidinium_carterae.1
MLVNWSVDVEQNRATAILECGQGFNITVTVAPSHVASALESRMCLTSVGVLSRVLGSLPLTKK